jgi:hypothetical protein
MSDSLLIPQPVHVEGGPPDAAPFPLHPGVSVVISHRHEQGEWIAALQVKAALERLGIDAPIQPQIHCNDVRQSIVLAVRGRDEPVFPGATITRVEPAMPDSPEAYLLSATAERIAVWGASAAGLARGVQTLRQLLATANGAVPALEIVDAPALAWRGVMLDISRGKIPTLETLEQVVDLIAAFKLNVLQLYTEHSFAFRRHPRIGQVWGSLTPEEIASLDQYCRDRYVELQPCLQSFGHLRRMLDLPEYAHLAETADHWSLAPSNEGTYALLDDLYADYLACFSSRNFNICSDETYDLGAGQSKELAERIGKGRVYLEHILRLHRLAQQYGRTMLVWDDIFLHHPDLVHEIPRDAIILNWSYEAAESYPQVEGFHEAGLRQVVCPGTSTWRTLFPRLANARGNIRNFVRSGVQVGALGVLTTDWGDDGHPNLLGSSWYGYTYGAAEGWAPGVLDDDEFERRFTLLVFGDRDAAAVREGMQALSDACVEPGIARRNGSHSILLFRGDVLTDEECRGIPDAALAAMRERGTRARALLAGVAGPGSGEARRTLDEYRLSADLVVYAAERGRAARSIAHAVEPAAKEAVALELQRLKRELHELRARYCATWLVRNKPDGLWLTLDQFDESARTLDAWYQSVARVYPWS